MNLAAAPSMPYPVGRRSEMRSTVPPTSAVLTLLQLLRRPSEEEFGPLTASTWLAVERAAVRHGLAPLLHDRLRNDTVLEIPADTLIRLRDVRLHSELRSAATRARLAVVLRRLQKADVPVIVLKGAVLAEEVYSTPGLRPMSDIDLLVPVDRLEDARATLLGLVYHSAASGPVTGHHHLPRFRKRGSLPIEVHWTPFPTERTVRKQLDDIWSSARPVTVAGMDVLSLAPEHLLHHLCLHAAYSHRLWISLLHLHDLAAVAERFPDLDRDRLAAISREADSDRFVHVALMLARRGFPGRIPDRLPLGEPSSLDRDVVDLVWASLADECNPLPRLLTRLAATPQFGERARLVSEFLIPPRQRLELHQDFVAGQPLRSHLLRLARHGRKAGRQMLDLFRRRGFVRRAWRSARSRALVERWARASPSATSPPSRPMLL
jgi:hypothetical protein